MFDETAARPVSKSSRRSSRALQIPITPPRRAAPRPTRLNTPSTPPPSTPHPLRPTPFHHTPSTSHVLQFGARCAPGGRDGLAGRDERRPRLPLSAVVGGVRRRRPRPVDVADRLLLRGRDTAGGVAGQRPAPTWATGSCDRATPSPRSSCAGWSATATTRSATCRWAAPTRCSPTAAAAPSRPTTSRFRCPRASSALWAVADAATQARIVAAHHAAVADVVELLEREVAATRTGATGPDGAVAQVEVAGIVAARFDHYDSRAGEPQLHSHLVLSNKVPTLHDGRWRSLDGRPIHAAVVAFRSTTAPSSPTGSPARWALHGSCASAAATATGAWEIAGVPQPLLAAFSSRSHSIQCRDRRADRGLPRAPRPASLGDGHPEVARTGDAGHSAAQAAPLAGRPHRPLARPPPPPSSAVDAQSWAAQLLAATRPPRLHRAEDLPPDVIAAVGRRVVEVVGEKRSTWRHWNLHAEASRQLMGLRFATTADRETVLDAVVDAAEAASLRLTPPDLAATPARLQRSDGSSVFRPRHATVFTSAALLAAEDRPPRARRHHQRTRRRRRRPATAGPARDRDLRPSRRPARRPRRSRQDHRIARPAQRLGSRHGPGSVIGLAPSAAAAQVLADELGITTETTAKWLHDRNPLRAGQLVIVDEASLAGTLTLDHLASQAAEAGAKMLLVGDWAQLAAVDAGGAFALLARARDDTPELTQVHRFHQPWEADASLQLRAGDPAVIDTYAQHDRLHAGDHDEMLDAAYTAWQADLAAGRASIMIAPTRDTVTALNTRARSDRIAAGDVATTGAVGLHDGTQASVGDLVVTRRNDRRLLAGKHWVRNGDRWTITATHPDGRITVQRRRRQRRPAPRIRRRPPRARLRDNDSSRPREHGRHRPRHRATRHDPRSPLRRDDPRPRRQQRLRHHRPRHDRRGRAHGRPVTRRRRAVRPPDDRGTSSCATRASPSSPPNTRPSPPTPNTTAGSPSCAAQASPPNRPPPSPPPTISAGSLPNFAAPKPTTTTSTTSSPASSAHESEADDIAAALRDRLRRATDPRTGSSRPRPAHRLIAGLIPQATGPMTDDMRQALAQRQQLIEQRAVALADSAIADDIRWLRQLGPPPRDSRQRQAWQRHVQTIAAYRDRHAITGDDPLGVSALTGPQRADATRARAALIEAQRLAWHPGRAVASTGRANTSSLPARGI